MNHRLLALLALSGAILTGLGVSPRALAYGQPGYAAPPALPPPAFEDPYAPPPPSARFRALLGLGVRFSGVALEGTKYNVESFENPVMGGAGAMFRSKITPRWGLELSFDYLYGHKESVTQVTMPVMLSALLYLFPESRIQPYGLLGMGVHLTSLQYKDLLLTSSGGSSDAELNLVEIAGQLGAGVEIFLTNAWSLHADLRFVTVYKNLDEHVDLNTGCIQRIGDTRGYCSGVHDIDPDDKFNFGLQFLAGTTYYF